VRYIELDIQCLLYHQANIQNIQIDFPDCSWSPLGEELKKCHVSNITMTLRTCKNMQSFELTKIMCYLIPSICSIDYIFKTQVLQILLSRCTTTERQPYDLCVCVCMSGVWTHDKTLNDESL
jgi:hypothetical protein